MPIYLFLSELAGQWPWLDGTARVLAVGALPLLGLVALAAFVWSPLGIQARQRCALTLALALTLGLAAAWALELAAHVWDWGVISPRPFLSRRATMLVAEAQNSSFPCWESFGGALFCFAVASLVPGRYALGALVLALALSAARLMASLHFWADVAAAWALALALWLLCAAVCNCAPLLLLRRHTEQIGAEPRRIRARLSWLGASLGVSAALAICLAAVVANTPRLARAFAAASAPASDPDPDPDPEFEAGPESESDWRAWTGAAQARAWSRRREARQEEAEEVLFEALRGLARPFALVDVEVAALRFSDSNSFTAAALRFEVRAMGTPQTRRQAAEAAARLVRGAYATPLPGARRLDHVDVVAFYTAASRQEARELDGSLVEFIGNEIPVLSASIPRERLVLRAPAWANWSGLDGGSWLRARSLLYINARVLPPSPLDLGRPVPTPMP